jgi:hypothetical protein
MEPIPIAVVNQSHLDDETVAKGVAALQKQVNEDFGPVWRLDAQLHQVARDRMREKFPDRWGLVLLDDDQDLKGYHELTSSGLPLAKVFVKRIAQDQDWTHAASHELLEMLVDPDGDLAVFLAQGPQQARFYAREVCDPCAAYADGYPINGWQVSNFVFPTWFRNQAGDSDANLRRFDERRSISAPLEVRPGGYIGIFDPASRGWKVLGSDGAITDPRDGRLAQRNGAADLLRTSDTSWAP